MCSIEGCVETKTRAGKCKFHYNEYMKNYIASRYKRLRAEWIDKLGGECVVCKTTSNLEFDHIDASQKEYNIAKILSTHSKLKVESEMKKCQLLCKECHLEKTYREEDLKSVDHGGGVSGKKGCSCGPCRAKRNEYVREWKRNRAKAPSPP